SPEMTQVVGCPIERKAPPTATRSLSRRRSAAGERIASLDAESKSLAHAAPLAITYAEHVAPILHGRCASCHRPGQVAPFSLLTYEQARRWARSIVEVVNDRRMPPWHADAHYGRFANDRSLSDLARAQLVAWVDQGTPSGDLSRAPEPPKFPQGWSI